MRQSPAAVLTLLLVAGCESRSYGAPPPPPPAPAPAPAAPTAAAEDSASESAGPAPNPRRERTGKAKRERQTKAEAPARKASAPAPAPASEPPAAAPAPKTPALPEQKAPTPASVPKSAVRVPRSEHVQIELPPGLQADLDRDPRMQPWVNKAVSAIERCYAPLRQAGTTGVIEVRLVMHENERPSAEPGKLPGALTPMLACVTGDLMRTKMPLFTGKEGARYTLKIRLSK